MQVLDKGGIPYRDVVVAEQCRPDPGPCQEQQYRQSYSNVYVSIVGPARSSVSGKINCYYYGADCSLLVQQLGLVNVPLRNLAGVHSRPGRVEYIVQYLKALLRVWTQPIQMHMR